MMPRKKKWDEMTPEEQEEELKLSTADNPEYAKPAKIPEPEIPIIDTQKFRTPEEQARVDSDTYRPQPVITQQAFKDYWEIGKTLTSAQWLEKYKAYPETVQEYQPYMPITKLYPDTNINDIYNQASTQPDVFLEDLKTRGNIEDQSAVLRQLGAKEEDISQILAPAEYVITPTLRRLYPDQPFIQPRHILTLATEDPETFAEDLLEKGKNNDSVTLLKSMFGMSDADINEFFKPVVAPVEEPVKNFWGKLDSWIKGWSSKLPEVPASKFFKEQAKQPQITQEQLREESAIKQYLRSVVGYEEFATSPFFIPATGFTGKEAEEIKFGMYKTAAAAVAQPFITKEGEKLDFKGLTYGGDARKRYEDRVNPIVQSALEYALFTVAQLGTQYAGAKAGQALDKAVVDAAFERWYARQPDVKGFNEQYKTDLRAAFNQATSQNENIKQTGLRNYMIINENAKRGAYDAGNIVEGAGRVVPDTALTAYRPLVIPRLQDMSPVDYKGTGVSSMQAVTQGAMQLKPESPDQAKAMVEGLRYQLVTDPVASTRVNLGGRQVGLDAFISLREQSFPEHFTVKQAQALMPHADWSKYTQQGLPTYNKVPVDAALDDLTKRFGMTPDEIAEQVMKVRQIRGQINELNAYIPPEAGMGMPETGLQKGFEGGLEPVTPKTRGKITQVSMEDQLKLRQYEQRVNPSQVAVEAPAITPQATPAPTAGITPPVETGEVEMALAEPPKKPPVPPTEEIPKGDYPEPFPNEVERLITQSQRQIELSPDNAIQRLAMRIPGLRQVAEFFTPKLKMTGENRKVLTALISERAAKSDIATMAFPTRQKLLKEITKVFGKDVLRGGKSDIKFVGTPEQAANPITGTLKDIADNPDLYALTPIEKSIIEKMNLRNNELLDWVVLSYGAEIGTYKPKPGGAYLPNVDISDDVVESLGSETRAVATGRGKTRVWATARDRMAHDKTFKPELDVQKLIEGMDSFKASAAGGITYRQALGGLTRLEAMKETHPALYAKMEGLRKQLQSLRGSLARLDTKLEKAVDDFLASPHEDVDLSAVQDSLDVKLATGPRAGMKAEDIQNQIESVRQQIKDIRPMWEAANLKPYVFVQEGIYRYFPSDTAKLIKESRQASNGAFDPIIKFGERFRQTAFSTDGSPITIQGQIGLMADPLGSIQAARGGIRSAIEERNWKRSFSMDALADRIAADPNKWAKYASLSGRALTGTPTEYAAGFLNAIPGIDKFNESIYLTVTLQSFDFWERKTADLMKSGVPQLDAEIIANDLANQVYPLHNPARAGQSQARASLLRALPTSYSFIMQPAELITEATTGLGKAFTFQKLTPRESMAVKTVITMVTSVMVASVTSAVLTALHRKKSPEEVLQAAKDAVNPDQYNGNFACLIVPVGDKDVRIPLGGPFRSIFRALYPGDVKGVPFPVPGAGLWNFFTNRINPALKTQIDLIRNKDYYGREILKGNAPERFLRAIEYELENALPLSVGSTIEDIRNKKERDEIILNTIGQFMGVNPVQLDNTYLFKEVRKLGELKDEEPEPFSVERPRYTTKDLWSNALRLLKDIPTDQVGRHNFPDIVKTIAETRDIKNEIDLLPNRKLADINSDYGKGDTYLQYFDQWQERSRITDPVKLAEFDKQYPNAGLGNMSLREYQALKEYHSLTPKEQEEYLKAHPELSLNPRDEWLKSHPKENALLALFGQAKITTLEAYEQVKSLIKSQDIPESAIPSFTLPPDKSVKNYFEYQKLGADLGYNSAEVKLLIAKDDDLREFLGREPVDTSIKTLELQVKNRDLTEQYDSYGNKESSQYIKDEKEREKARDEFKSNNPKWVDDNRRIQAYSNNGDEYAEKWVEHGQISDKGEGYNVEEKLWLVDNPDVHDWALENKLLTDNGEDWNIPAMRLTAKYRKEDEEYDAIPGDDTEARKAYLFNNEEYRKDRRRREAYQMTSETGEKFPEAQIENYVNYHEIEKPEDWTSRTQQSNWYEDDWYLMENPDFYENVYLKMMGNEKRDFRKVPERKVFEKYLEYVRLPEPQRKSFRWFNKDLDEWGQIAFGWKPVSMTPVSSTDRLNQSLQDIRNRLADLPPLIGVK